MGACLIGVSPITHERGCTPDGSTFQNRSQVRLGFGGSAPCIRHSIYRITNAPNIEPWIRHLSPLSSPQYPTHYLGDTEWIHPTRMDNGWT